LNFDEQLKQYRKKLGLSQEKMANFLEINIKTYQSWEQGLRKPIAVYRKMIIGKIEDKFEVKDA